MSKEFDRARKTIPGGVNSPVRAFGGVGGEPPFIEHAKGPYVFDTQGRRYIDYVGSWGPMIAGHAHPDVIKAVQETAARGLSFGAPTELETELAEQVCSRVPSLEMVRMVNSGTEATMSAIRLARGYTGRDRIVKFEGCYHGHSDSLLVKAGSGALTFGVPTSPGVPAAFAEQTITLTYNDCNQVHELCDKEGDTIACIIVEPVAGNMNCVLPGPGFLECLREACDRAGAVLIFDEVMTGFRVASGGAQELFEVTPDLTTLGKVLGGGMPVGAFGGREHIMQQLAPSGPVYQAGTLSGNPVAMAAGLIMLAIISKNGFYERLAATTSQLANGLLHAAEKNGIPLVVNQICGMFGLFFTDKPSVTQFRDVMACDLDRFKLFFHHMLDAGVYLAPSAFEAGFVSSAHEASHIEETLEIVNSVFSKL